MPNEAPPRGLRIFTCAHSFHNFVPPILAELADAAGITGHQTVGLSMIGGSRVIQHWDVPEPENLAKAALRGGTVDVLTLSPIWLPDDGIENFARLAIEHNPKIRITVQAFWLPNDEYVPVYPLQSNKAVDHNAATVAELRACHDRYMQDLRSEVRRINERLGNEAVLVVPVGPAVVKLRERIIAGEAPGLKTQAELFADSWGHPWVPVQTLNAYCHYVAIYGRSPVGLPMPSILARSEHKAWRDEKLNRLLQELAWAG